MAFSQKRIKLNIYPIIDQLVQRAERERFLNQRAHVFWLTGLSGSGKSTIAKAVERSLFDQGYFVQIIDGDNVRTGLCSDLGFSLSDREENIRRIAELARLYLNSGVVCICSFISPTESIRKLAKQIIGAEDFSEIYINCSLKDCEQRDPKGLYKKARSGKISGFTGIDSPYEVPENPDFEIDSLRNSPDASASLLFDFVKNKIHI